MHQNSILNDQQNEVKSISYIELNDDPMNNVLNVGRRRSNAFSFTESTKTVENESHLEENNKNESLISTTLQLLKHKDFVNEFRSKRDIELFVSDSCVLLDCQTLDLESIIEQMLSLISDEKVIEEAKQSIFAQKNQLLSNTIQGIYLSDNEEYEYDQSWLCTYCSLPSLLKRKVCIARLTHPTNLGLTSHDIKFLIIVLAPIKEKATKSAEEASRAFATIFADITFRYKLLNATNENEFIGLIERRAHKLSENAFLNKDFLPSKDFLQKSDTKQIKFRLSFCRGIAENVSRRAKYYWSDFVDGFVGPKTIHKTLSTTVSLFFACLLPCIAFGVLDDRNTDGLIDARRALVGQTIGGLVFALLAGQPLVIIATTAPLCLYTKVVFDISHEIRVDFYDMFACVGLWNALFVIIYSVLDVSVLMKWCTRSTEEIFALFIFFAFSIDAIKGCVKNFESFYCMNECNISSTNQTTNYYMNDTISSTSGCAQQNSVLFVFLMLATLWLALILYDFNKTPYLNGNKREILADYALPLSVIAFSFVGSFLFKDIKAEPFKFSNRFEFSSATFKTLTVEAVFISMALGFALSLLFFMDQNISAALVNNPNNNLKKGSAYHWDLFIVGVLNAFLSVFGFPWMHGILPHSPIHARSLADVEQRSVNGYVRDIVIRIRETRITGLGIHILIGLSLLVIRYLKYIPISVLNGLFLYCAFGTLRDNSFFERILLFITEQTAYPPNHYVRRCPQRKIHLFTGIQLIQLAVLCFFGFAPWPYVQMAFPVIIAILIPIRSKIIPLFLEKKYIEAIDGYH